ncbi:heavy metal translocatin [Basidiobolus meristosporus CBS 931.73]|uniref:P-type Cu(+) transporter n=1 Tax=Basidiobolus meristosporus CBS 931.73 TaxID=1314790 RepID=A0A1Y1WXP3_9FUNG|nr:heavy metal translocatin [Basidiobolus meristosporus CBS 931.73]|eukprot:ORX78321.1 heavy metal translocatin [Basidiobolus meristosporus CBS 931.73]
MQIEGMTCSSCVKSAEKALAAIDSILIDSISVSSLTGRGVANFTLDDRERLGKAIEKSISNIGYDLVDLQWEMIPNQTQPTSSQPPASEESLEYRAVMQIEGMTCSSCVKTTEKALTAIESILPETISVSALTGRGVAVFTNGDQESLGKIIEEAISNIGYDLVDLQWEVINKKKATKSTVTMSRATMQIEGMTCSSCVKTTEKALSAIETIVEGSISVSALTGRGVAVFANEDQEALGKVIEESISNIGYDLVDLQWETIQENDPSDQNESGEATTVTTNLNITGMTCSSCVNSIESNLRERDGIISCQINLLMQSGVVVHDPTKVGPRTLVELISDLGYEATVVQPSTKGPSIQERHAHETRSLLIRFLWALSFAIPAFIIGIIFDVALSKENRVRRAFASEVCPGLSVSFLIMWILATPVQFILAWPFYRKAYKSLRYAHTANMDVLVSLGTGVAYFASVGTCIANIVDKSSSEKHQFFDTTIYLITFILFGKFLEAHAKGRTFDTISKLMELQAETATLVTIKEGQPIENAQEEEIDFALVQQGDILKVNPGTRIPCDGTLYHGTSTFDESTITGESIPVRKSAENGDRVISATLNLTSPVYFIAEKVGADTTLSRIIKLVQDAQSAKKAPMEQLADMLSGVFVPLVVALAIVTFILWCALGYTGHVPTEWITKQKTSPGVFALWFAITVLVIACPCGLGLASPTAIMVGTGVAAKHGILIKGGGLALEMINRLDAIVFDKTGTLTIGKPIVSGKRSDDDSKTLILSDAERLLWELVHKLESGSEHPLARAVVESCQEVPGKGIEAVINVATGPEAKIFPGFIYSGSDGQESELEFASLTIQIGSPGWITSIGSQYASSVTDKQTEDREIEAFQNTGASIVQVAINGFIVLTLGVADRPREHTAEIIRELEKRGIQVWMLTGDHRISATAIAREIGIKPERVMAQVVPEEKASKVASLQTQGGRYFPWLRDGIPNHRNAVVAMVGDGINDSPALAQADVGISPSSGTDIAIEAASIILNTPNLISLLTMLDLSAKVLRRIRYNFAWAFFYNFLAIPVAAGVFYPLWLHPFPPELAGLAMVLSSVTVICSSLHLKRFRAKKYL